MRGARERMGRRLGVNICSVTGHTSAIVFPRLTRATTTLRAKLFPRNTLSHRNAHNRSEQQATTRKKTSRGNIDKMAREAIATALLLACVVALAWGQECAIEEGMRRQGASFNDFSAFYTDSPEECCKACMKNERCLSWTRDRRTQACALKDAIPGLTRDGDFDSGVVGGAPAMSNIPPASCFLQPGAKYGGGDVIRRSRASGARKCCERCENDLNCFSWYYNKRNSRCIMNSDVPKMTSRKAAVGGTVV